MKSRLETLNPELAEQLNSSDLSEAMDKVKSMLLDRLEMLPDRAVRLLPESFEVQSYRVSQHQIDILDDCYFAAEETGSDEDASAAFLAARFLSAVLTWQTASSQLELCEAAYEAQFTHS